MGCAWVTVMSQEVAKGCGHPLSLPAGVGSGQWGSPCPPYICPLAPRSAGVKVGAPLGVPCPFPASCPGPCPWRGSSPRAGNPPASPREGGAGAAAQRGKLEMLTWR